MRIAYKEVCMPAWIDAIGPVALMAEGRLEAPGASRADRAMQRAYAIARRLLIDLGRRSGPEEGRAHDVRDPEELSPEEALHLRRLEAEARRDLALLPRGVLT